MNYTLNQVRIPIYEMQVRYALTSYTDIAGYCYAATTTSGPMGRGPHLSRSTLLLFSDT